MPTPGPSQPRLDAPDLPEADECCEHCGGDSQSLAELAGHLYCPACHRAGLVGEVFDSYAPFMTAPLLALAA